MNEVVTVLVSGHGEEAQDRHINNSTCVRMLLYCALRWYRTSADANMSVSGEGPR